MLGCLGLRPRLACGFGISSSAWREMLGWRKLALKLRWRTLLARESLDRLRLFLQQQREQFQRQRRLQQQRQFQRQRRLQQQQFLQQQREQFLQQQREQQLQQRPLSAAGASALAWMV